MSLYESDFYSWTLQQAALIDAGRYAEMDMANIQEELADLGSNKYDSVVSGIELLYGHLLKWKHQPRLRGPSWEMSIKEQRRRIPKLLKKNPGLKGRLAEITEEGLEDGRALAIDETGLSASAFPEECPWSLEQMLNADFWPD